jgi:three-Cys-motif partner protein
MTVPNETIWKLDPHTAAKHAILRLYLQRWFPILNTYHGRVIYIDGFCGPGRYKDGEPGSPLVVLELAANHIKTLKGDIIFRFIDEREDRIEHLNSELAKLTKPSNFNIKALQGRFDEKLKEFLDKVDEKGVVLGPTFVFIDPFGFSGVPYPLVRRILEKPHTEVFITFMADAINRWLDHPEENIRNHIAEIFGTTDCFNIDRSSPNRIGLLRDIYQKQLEKTAKFVRYFDMRDRTGRVEYLLFFASNHPLGHVKMKEAMWGVDPNGEFRFSDATNPDQQVMFGDDHQSFLWPILKNEFSGRRVRTEEIFRFTEDKTAFLDKHAKATLKEHEDYRLPASERIVVDEFKADGKKRRKDTFPDGVIVTFPN